jgi:PTH2 family peptidyl-tRNA hydrolase
MRKGKQFAQAAHASIKVLLDRGHFIQGSDEHPNMFVAEFTDAMKEWCEGLFTKICVGVSSEEELDDIYNKAIVAGIPCSMIIDAGLTEFHGIATKTCCAIGPDDPEKINQITGHLKLL